MIRKLCHEAFPRVVRLAAESWPHIRILAGSIVQEVVERRWHHHYHEREVSLSWQCCLCYLQCEWASSMTALGQRIGTLPPEAILWWQRSFARDLSADIGKCIEHTSCVVGDGASP